MLAFCLRKLSLPPAKCGFFSRDFPRALMLELRPATFFVASIHTSKIVGRDLKMTNFVCFSPIKYN